jgi:molybdopterin-guanine dinucleotide biosynthesis protein A
MRREVLASLRAFLGSGQRKIDRWYSSLEVVEVPFDHEAEAFLNINTREELASLEPPRP